jgi:hypothetical protein
LHEVSAWIASFRRAFHVGLDYVAIVIPQPNGRFI